MPRTIGAAATALSALVLMLATTMAWAGQPWHGDYFPNVVLTDQDGKKAHFYDDLIRDKIVSINFVYTTCRDICPADTARLLRVQELLGEKVGRDVFMYSISIEPEKDTPAALKRYMHTFGVKPGWRFLTGAKADIELLQRKLGMRAFDPDKPQDHDTSVMVGNEKIGQWIKRSLFDDPLILTNLLADTLTNFSVDRSGKLSSYAVAPRIPDQSSGEYLFRTRCVSCHSIGGGDRLGPDLAGVAQARPRDWLARWLKEPDKMIAENDPVALALKARYRNLPMPNLGLNDIDAAALIEYLEKEDARAATSANRAAKAS
ncbi:MAG: SCO family protein [Alphaproteobacteria bacterium]|nr:SCO family protein [Alphaproteobacteria bacterium]